METLSLSPAVCVCVCVAQPWMPPGQAGDPSLPPPTSPSVFWLLIYSLFCLASLILGFQFSRLIFFLLFETLTVHNSVNPPLLGAVRSSKEQHHRSLDGPRLRIRWDHDPPLAEGHCHMADRQRRCGGRRRLCPRVLLLHSALGEMEEEEEEWAD